MRFEFSFLLFLVLLNYFFLILCIRKIMVLGGVKAGFCGVKRREFLGDELRYEIMKEMVIFVV